MSPVIDVLALRSRWRYAGPRISKALGSSKELGAMFGMTKQYDSNEAGGGCISSITEENQKFRHNPKHPLECTRRAN